jgi:hypothetical protein
VRNFRKLQTLCYKSCKLEWFGQGGGKKKKASTEIMTNQTVRVEQKEAMLELDPLPLEGDLLKTLNLALKKYIHIHL